MFLKGPLLFLIYINDLPNSIKTHIYASLFTDDAKIVYSFKPTESYLPLQCAIDEFSDWMKISLPIDGNYKLLLLNVLSCELVIKTLFIHILSLNIMPKSLYLYRQFKIINEIYL